MSELIKMDPELKQKWTSALRGSDYIQAKEIMYHEGMSKTSGKLAMCCLGVLEHLCGTDISRMDMYMAEFMPDHVKGGRRSPEESLKQEVRFPHLKSEGRTFVGTFEGYLAHMNDYGKTFKEIADFIDKNI